MIKKIMSWKTKGMNKDLSVSAFSPEFSFDNRNLRLSTNESNTMLSWVNERGTLKQSISIATNPWVEHPAYIETVPGIPVGTAVINHKLVLFTVDGNTSYIFKLWFRTTGSDALDGVQLYAGNLNLDVEHPLETLVSYEAENIQKVYWVDGKNQPRVINIESDNETLKKWHDTSGYTAWFDFVPELQLNEKIYVKKLLGAGGMFAPGVIQYAFTYYNKYGQESNIFYTSSLLYISYGDRGASPEDKVDNAFQITIKNLDKHFDYLRIYSIQRTSIDGTPICKRLQDIELSGVGNEVSYTDIGTSGNAIDPTELLYKGGESIVAKTIEQKDNTLFLGNISINRDQLKDFETDIKNAINISPTTRKFSPEIVSNGSYRYGNQLTASDSEEDREEDRTVPCAGFKRGNYYRFGIQFQHKSGKWSEPVYIKDDKTNEFPDWDKDNKIKLPIFTGTNNNRILSSNLINAGYKKARAVVVYPRLQDKWVLCQGIACPTVFIPNHRGKDINGNPVSDALNDLYAQSSWMFRLARPDEGTQSENQKNAMTSRGTVWPEGALNKCIPYADRYIENGENGEVAYNPEFLRTVEIQGHFDTNNKFWMDYDFLNLYSPDVEFDTSFNSVDFTNVTYERVGQAQIKRTLSDIDIQTETPTISNAGAGFIHKSFVDNDMYGIVSGLFYDDFPLDDGDDAGPVKYKDIWQPVKWMVYLWNKDGSLNNDMNRPADKGVASAVLKRKIISNLRYFNETEYTESAGNSDDKNKAIPQLFSSEDDTIIKVENDIYKGNIDTVLMPDRTDGMYFLFAADSMKWSGIIPPKKLEEYDNLVTPFNGNTYWWKTFNRYDNDKSKVGQYMWVSEGNTGHWEHKSDYIGNSWLDLAIKKDPVRMKYKSTSHLVFKDGIINEGGKFVRYINWDHSKLPVIEMIRNTDEEVFKKMIFGGDSPDALKENVWIPCGEPVDIKANGFTVKYEWGDTYYQRWDCLKTYAFTPEDKNQVVEIGSFMLESYVNIDGRYDRNRGQLSNLYMSPRNFNLLNPVYSQLNNFFTYKILDGSYYDNDTFPNQLTWSKAKESGADVDLWTNVTLASILELDGNKGKLNKLVRFNNYLFAFQDTGLAQILYNDNVQISSTDGVPIEIANSGKVQGKDYKSDSIGCSNKWSIVTTPAGIYFVDSHDKSMYLFNGELNSLSIKGGFSAWSKRNIIMTGKEWNPLYPEVLGHDKLSDFVSYYDKHNQDILFINKKYALAWSEKLQVFTSYYDYGETPYFINLDGYGLWLSKDRRNDDGHYYIWKHQAGNYCSFFNVNKSYSMTLVGNPEPQADKTFTNLEFRACVEGDGEVDASGEFLPFLPFDSLETWNEYQHGIALLRNLSGPAAYRHHDFNNADASLRRKYRIWRCDIPRDNADENGVFDETFNETFHPTSRTRKRPMDRMRNPWLYLRLHKDPDDNATMLKTEIHDLLMTYFT